MQIYCFDALTLENKFSVLTYPVPQLAGQGAVGVNVGFGPMAVGPRWLAYASNNPLLSNTGRLSPQNLTPSPGVSPSTSPGGSSLVARYAMESSKHLATGLINLGDMGYRTLSKCCQELLPDGSHSPVSHNSVWKVGRLAGNEMDNAGTVSLMLLRRLHFYFNKIFLFSIFQDESTHTLKFEVKPVIFGWHFWIVHVCSTIMHFGYSPMASKLI